MSAFPRALVSVALVLVSATCSDPFALPPAREVNVVDTLVLFALDGTPIGLPSALNLPRAELVRTDRTADFDVALNFDAEGPVLLPTGVLGYSDRSAFRSMTVGFDDVAVAPTEGYRDDAPVRVAAGDVLILRSRPVPCFGSRLFIYGKVEILDVDPAARTVRFQILVNRNCGYRSLEPGRPGR